VDAVAELGGAPVTEPFDILDALPTGTTVLEASAGTGKTYAIAALVTRYVAEDAATLDQMLVLTFGRAASQELRERVRDQLVEAEAALADPETARAQGGLLAHLAGLPDTDAVRRRLAAALASYDAATIATIHQFCQVVLRSLGVAGDTDTRAELVEDLTDLVTEVVDDLYLTRFAGTAEPPFDRARALTVARSAMADPQAVPVATGGSDAAAARLEFAQAVLAEVDRRKRRLGVLSYDDLLTRLAHALERPDSPARDRMRARWKVVLVDEFQDTDPVQWQVLDRAFTGHAAMVLIGDPKQAIYAFRGGDIHSYLRARDTAGTMRTLALNHRSDPPLVEALQVLTRNVELGNEQIVVHDVAPAIPETRLAGAPSDAAVRLRRIDAGGFDANDKGQVRIDDLRRFIARDLAADIAQLIAAKPTFKGERLKPEQVAVLMSSVRPALVEPFRKALADHGIASVITTGSSVLLSAAASEWQTLLEAMEQPATTRRIRAVGLTAFGGYSAAGLAAGGDDATDRLADSVRGWLDLFRTRGIAAVHEAIVAGGLDARVLARPDGERLLTDLDHLAQVLHDVARRDRLGLPALLAWLRAERAVADKSSERTRRLDTDANAVQFLTIHGSKGLQYPVVYLPTLFDRWSPSDTEAVLFHDDDGDRRLDIGGSPSTDTIRRSRAEDCAEELRLTYVALTRAESQVVAWWGPSAYACDSGLTRMLLGRSADEAAVPATVPLPSAAEVDERLRAWAGLGAFALERAEVAADIPAAHPEPPPELVVRVLGRPIDEAWQRTSYSGLIRVEEQASALAPESEPEVEGTVDEPGLDDGETPQVPRTDTERPEGDVPSPMAALPAGATFGSLVHAVLEHADPQADDLPAELLARVREQQQWWSVDASAEAIASALVPMQTTSLGPLANGLRLVDLGKTDRLCELDFEIPLTGGDQDPAPPEIRLADLAGVLRRHLAPGDPMLAYADQLEAPALGGQLLRGYLSGSIDVVLRVPDPEASGGVRYLVVDYKTNLLGDRGTEITAWDYRPEALTAAMLHSHYPLQALLYSVVLHRYLRWRQPGYDPERHLGGMLYLYVRGMCGPETPEVEGQPCGVFAWRPPAGMIVELSALLAAEVQT
jgi:exodeoxyribonuclease V beta subunit